MKLALPNPLGGYHSLSVCNDGTDRAWGYNGYGELGDGTNTDQSTPVQVSGFTGSTAVAAAGWHSLALKNDGTAWAWGYNGEGELGDGTNTDRSTPVQVNGLTGITAVAAGALHSLALKNDGTAWAWGWNGYGQLGDGTTNDQNTPVQVSGLTGITAVAAGGYHSLALKNNGTAWAWGWNGYGRLGDGTTTNRSTPVQVSGLTGITVVAAGWHHSLALKNDGTAWAWGWNVYGQLGDGTTNDQSTPVQVNGLTGITAVAAGWDHSLALKNNGTVWAWGYNADGELGDGTLTDRSTPVQSTPLCTVSLPIELLSFDATSVKNTYGKYYVRCNWATATEINNDYFVIERGTVDEAQHTPTTSRKETKEIQFELIGTVKGAGNSSIIQNYSFVDNPPSTIIYYRLKQTDYDGKYTYSDLVSVNLSGNNAVVSLNAVALISIAPNPVINNFEYKIGSTEKMSVQVKVVDMLGQIVINKTETIEKGITSKRVDVSELSSGTYILQIITENKEVEGKQFQIK